MIQIPRFAYNLTQKASNAASNALASIPTDFVPQQISNILYPVKGGKLAERCDGKRGWIVLISLGLSCSFSLRAPGMEQDREFQLDSGDVLIYECSKEADIHHGANYILCLRTQTVSVFTLITVLSVNRNQEDL